MTTYDAKALEILLGSGSEKTKQAKLSKLAKEARARLENRVECPDCGSEGPHDDNGCSGAQQSFCCADCGMHFEAQ